MHRSGAAVPRKEGHLVKHSAGCCLPASWFIFISANSFTMALQALLLNSASYFFTFQWKWQNDLYTNSALCVFVAKSPRKNRQQSWEWQKSTTNTNSYRGGNDKAWISNCVSLSGTLLWKSSVNYMVSSTAILTWTGYDLYDKKSTRAGSHLTKLALPLTAHPLKHMAVAWTFESFLSSTS